MSGGFNQNVQSNSQLESITVSDTVYAARRQICFKHGRSQSDSTHTAVISSSLSSTSSRREKTASGIFSFLRWFRKEKGDADDDADDDDSDENDIDIGSPSVPPSPQLIRSHSSSCGSVDTLFSTATANSFAFIHPAYYRPFGTASQAETRIAEGPETDTYRQRVQQTEKLKELDKDISLKKKYHLFGSGTIYRSVDNISGRFAKLGRSNESLSHKIPSVSRNSTLNRKKRKAPPPPKVEKPNDYSLPNTLEHLSKQKNTKSENSQKSVPNKPQHRRTVSDSSKDKKAGAYCHVRGKRKAPPPPIVTNQNNSSPNKSTGNHSLGKKKRPAPQPPVQVLNNLPTSDTSNVLSSNSPEENKENEDVDKEKRRGSLSPEEKERLIKNIVKLQAVAEKRNSICTPPSSPHLGMKMPFTICNDSLKLEKGVLKSNKSGDGPSPTSTTSSTSSTSQVMEPNKFAPPSPVSPRPWYKRNIMRDQSTSNSGKFFDKKKDKAKMEDWMPEVAIARGSLISNESGKFNLFSSKPEKNEEKRKSQISMLVNISELDREAAGIVQKEHAKEKAILEAEDAKFYSFPETVPPVLELYNKPDDEAANVDVPKRSSARELISLFNAITNVTKVTVNSTFFSSKDGSSLFSRDSKEKRYSFGSSNSGNSAAVSENVCTAQEKIILTESVIPPNVGLKKETVVFEAQEMYLESPGERRRRWNKLDFDKGSGMPIGEDESDAERSHVTIEEIEDFDKGVDDSETTSKTQALYEANRLRRHHSPSPSIPTIAEMSESASSVTTSPGSTMNQHLTTPTTPTTPTPFPPALTSELKQPNKRVSIWVCPQCTLENPLWRYTCEACDMWKPPQTSNNTALTATTVNKTNDLNHVNSTESDDKAFTNNIDLIYNDKKEDDDVRNNLDIVKQKDINRKSNDIKCESPNAEQI